VAFDAAGNRLGQGAGCYDRTLAALRAKREVIAIGLAFAGQEVDRLEPEPHDQRLDAVLTEKGFRRFGPAFER
jgi:5-formyltetrahydrofolate cyclo-ligase